MRISIYGDKCLICGFIIENFPLEKEKKGKFSCVQSISKKKNSTTPLLYFKKFDAIKTSREVSEQHF